MVAFHIMKGFRWIHTPGHSPSHISLFREEDGCLIVGDAFVTVKQESLYKVLTQELELAGHLNILRQIGIQLLNLLSN